MTMTMNGHRFETDRFAIIDIGSLTSLDNRNVGTPKHRVGRDGHDTGDDTIPGDIGDDVIPGGLVVIPRTTVSDVRQLAAYWSNGLDDVGGHSVADASGRHVLDRWNAAVAEIERIPHDVDADAIYAHNTEFWAALMAVAIQVAVADEAPGPGRWTTLRAPEQVVERRQKTFSRALRDVMGMGKRGLASLVTKPVAYVGGTLLGVSVLYLLFRKPKVRDPTTQPVSGSAGTRPSPSRQR